MRLLEERIRRDGVVGEGDVLKIGGFLNQQMDMQLLRAMGEEFARLFGDCRVNKILTIEASGIGIAAAAAPFFGYCPVVFAKKSRSSNVAGDVYSGSVYSYTHGQTYDIVVPKAFLTPSDRVLLMDDFLANGCALKALLDVAGQAGATVVGAGIAVEKAYQAGGREIRESGVRVESLARVASMSVKDGITFC